MPLVVEDLQPSVLKVEAVRTDLLLWARIPQLNHRRPRERSQEKRDLNLSLRGEMTGERIEEMREEKTEETIEERREMMTGQKAGLSLPLLQRKMKRSS